MLLLIILFVLVLTVVVFMQSPRFGKKPSGLQLQRIKAAPNYSNGQFQNKSFTPPLAEGASSIGVIKKFFFHRSKRSKPATKLPSVKTNLFNLNPSENVLVWFGHSSYYLQVDGKKILVDPVFSGSASPVKFTTRSFNGSDVYTTDDIPELDYLFISHDHYDHLDYKTVSRLRPKVRKVITGLGVGAHLQRWGYEADRIIEKNWDEEWNLAEGFALYITTARHFSGRKFKRNGSLWLSFVLTTPSLKLFLGGDSGYDSHFATIGALHGPFDLAILENGQYNEAWKYIHMMPEEAVQAAIDLKAKKLLPVHWAKFSLALHDWDEPIKRLVKEATEKGMPVVHPMIGEAFYFDKPTPQTAWWEEV